MFKQTNIIEKEININNLINNFRPLIIKEVSSQVMEINFEIKIFLDPNLNSCAKFTTNKVNYKPTNQFLYDFKTSFNDIFYLWTEP